MINERVVLTYQCTGTYFGEGYPLLLPPNKKCLPLKIDIKTVHSKNCWRKEIGSFIDSQRNMKLSHIKQGHGYGKMTVEPTKFDGRLGIPKLIGLKQLETRSPFCFRG